MSINIHWWADAKGDVVSRRSHSRSQVGASRCKVQPFRRCSQPSTGETRFLMIIESIERPASGIVQGFRDLLAYDSNG